MKDRIDLEDVALLGRTFKEYCTYFQLKDDDLAAGRVLDMAAGPGSFCAEATAHGYHVTAADPIYGSTPEAIAEKSRSDLDEVMRQLPEVMHKYNWTFYSDPSELGRHRERARRIFLEDYSRDHKRYIRTALPKTPFEDKEFSLVLVSHFLFLYDDWFDYDFHKASVLELARIAQREIRIYPLINMRAIRSSYVERLMHDPACSALTFERVKSDFEFFKNADQLLVIRTE